MFFLFNIALTPCFFLTIIVLSCIILMYQDLFQLRTLEKIILQKIYSFRPNDTITNILPFNNKSTDTFTQGCVTHSCIFSQIASIL